MVSIEALEAWRDVWVMSRSQGGEGLFIRVLLSTSSTSVHVTIFSLREYTYNVLIDHLPRQGSDHSKAYV